MQFDQKTEKSSRVSSLGKGIKLTGTGWQGNNSKVGIGTYPSHKVTGLNTASDDSLDHKPASDSEIPPKELNEYYR